MEIDCSYQIKYYVRNMCSYLLEKVKIAVNQL